MTKEKNENLYEKVCSLIEENNSIIESNIQKINPSYKSGDLSSEIPENDYSGLSLEELYIGANKLSKGNLRLAYENLSNFRKERGFKEDLEGKILIEPVEQEPEKTKEGYFAKIGAGIKSKLNKFVENYEAFGKGTSGKYLPCFGKGYFKKDLEAEVSDAEAVEKESEKQIIKELDGMLDEPNEKTSEAKEGYFTKIKNKIKTFGEKYSKSVREGQRIDEIITRARNIKRIRKKRLAREKQEQKKYESEKDLAQEVLEYHGKQEIKRSRKKREQEQKEQKIRKKKISKTLQEKHKHYSEAMQEIIKKNKGEAPLKETPEGEKYHRYGKTTQLIEKIAQRQGVSYKPSENYFTKIKDLIKSETSIVGDHFKDVYFKFAEGLENLGKEYFKGDLETEVLDADSVDLKETTKEETFSEPNKFIKVYDSVLDFLANPFIDEEIRKERFLAKETYGYLGDFMKKPIEQRITDIEYLRDNSERVIKNKDTHLIQRIDLIGRIEDNRKLRKFNKILDNLYKERDSLNSNKENQNLETEVSTEAIDKRLEIKSPEKIQELERKYGPKQETEPLVISKKDLEAEVSSEVIDKKPSKLKNYFGNIKTEINKNVKNLKDKFTENYKIFEKVMIGRDYSSKITSSEKDLEIEVSSEAIDKKYETDEFKKKSISEQIQITRGDIKALENDINKKKEHKKARELLKELYEEQKRAWSNYVKDRESESDEEQKSSNTDKSD